MLEADLKTELKSNIGLRNKNESLLAKKTESCATASTADKPISGTEKQS